MFWGSLYSLYININFLSINIDISTVEGAPGYPEAITVKDQTGDRVNLVGVYRRQGDIPSFAPPAWKYGDFELSFNGNY